MLKKNGMTLIELIVGFVLLTGGMTILIHMMSIGMFADSNLEQGITAMNLANEKMEELKNTAFAGISSGSETGSSIGFSVFDSRVVTVTNTQTDLKDVKVEVQWTQKGGQQSVAVEAYIADYE
jgi:Tfp pilus assembly protein PilV